MKNKNMCYWKHEVVSKVIVNSTLRIGQGEDFHKGKEASVNKVNAENTNLKKHNKIKHNKVNLSLMTIFENNANGLNRKLPSLKQMVRG